MSERRLKRWERQEVHQVTRQWVQENCQNVTARDLHLGRMLLKRRIMRRDQVQVLHPGFRDLANPEVQVNRRLRVLYDCHFIDRTFPQVAPGTGSSQAIVALDRAGAIMVGMPFKRVIRHQRDIKGNIQRILPLDYRHTLAIHDFEISLLQHCFATGTELLRWRIEHENQRRFMFGQEYVIRPDGFGIVRLPNGKGKAFLFEYDTGTEDQRCRTTFKRLTAKLKAYAAYRDSGVWLQEDWGRMLKEFPPLIFLTEDKKRIEPLKEIAATMRLVCLIGLSGEEENILPSILK